MSPPASVVTSHATTQRGVVGVLVERVHAELVDHPDAVAFRGRLDEPGCDQLEERLVIDHGEPEPAPGGPDRIHQEFRSCPGDYRDRTHRRTVGIDTQLQGGLAGVKLVVAGPHQRRELGVGMGRPQMLHDHSLAMPLFHDLHRGRTRPGLHFPQIRAHKPDSNRPLVPQNHPPQAPDKQEH